MKAILSHISPKAGSTGGLLLFLLLAIGMMSFKTSHSRLILEIRNIEQAGTLYVSLCRSSAEWSDNGTYTFKFPNSATGKNTYEIDVIPPGTYAVALFQDLNGNGKLDANFFGIPKEPYAFSNDEKPVLSAPSFEKCQFQFQQDNQVVSIHLLN